MAKGLAVLENYKAEQVKRQQEYEENKDKPRAFGLIVKSGESAEISFLDSEPDSYWVHTFEDAQGKWKTRLCLGENCPFCAKGNKKKFRSFYTVVDHRERSFINKMGEEVTVSNQVRYLEVSPSNAEALANMVKKDKRYKTLHDCVVDISKTGTGKNTTTSFMLMDREDTHIIPPDAEVFDFSEVLGISAATAVKEATGAVVPKYN